MIIKSFLPGQKSNPWVIIFLKRCSINLESFSVGLGATVCIRGAHENKATMKNRSR